MGHTRGVVVEIVEVVRFCLYLEDNAKKFSQQIGCGMPEKERKQE